MGAALSNHWRSAAPIVLLAISLIFVVHDSASAQTIGPPQPPTGLAAAATHEAITLTWDAPQGLIVDGYQVLRRSRDGATYGDNQGAPTFAIVEEDTGSTDVGYEDQSILPGTRYVYRIKARNSAGLSPWSDSANAETPAAPASQAKDAVPKSDACPGAGTSPASTAVTVDDVHIVVTSTTAEYFVLYVSAQSDRCQHDHRGDCLSCSKKRRGAGTTTLSESVAALPKDRYRVEKYLVANPADVDGDCVDDITELGNPATMNPVNPAAAIAIATGAVAVPSLAAFDTISRGEKKFFGKFIIFGLDTDRPGIYFQNTNKYLGHEGFLQSRGHGVGRFHDERRFSLLRSGPYCTRRKPRTLLCLGTSNQAVQPHGAVLLGSCGQYGSAQ